MSSPAFPQTIVLCLYGMVEKLLVPSLAVTMYTQGIYSHIHVKSAPTMAACMAFKSIAVPFSIQQKFLEGSFSFKIKLRGHHEGLISSGMSTLHASPVHASHTGQSG